MTEFEKARDDYRKAREGEDTELAYYTARVYISRLEAKVIELESHLRNRTSRGSW